MFTRALVFVLSLLGFALCGALIVREAALAGGGKIAWGVPGWWRETVRAGAWERAGVAGGVVLALVVLCLVLAVRVAVPRRDGAGGRVLELGERDARVRVSVEILERMVTIALASQLGGGRVRRVRVTRRDGRLVTRTRLTAASTDLAALHGRVLAIVRRDLGGATGLEVERLVLEVDRFAPAEGERS